MIEKVMRNCGLIAVACSLSWSVSAIAETRANLNVPAGELATALKMLASQTRLDLVYRLEQVQSLHTAGVKGEYLPVEAVERLLEGTGLRVYATASGAMMIAPAGGTLRIDRETAALRLGSEALIQASDAESSSNAPAGSTGTEGARLEEVIVTAQKRTERLQDVPISITVMRGAQLDKSNALGTTEILNRVPGVVLDEFGYGGAPRIMIRGVTSANALAGGASTAAYYLDSVPFGFVYNAVVPDTNVYDLDRIEVLRGPQGTLYGANSLAGVVRVLPHEADLAGFEFKTRASTSSTKGGGWNYRGDMAVNVPIIENRLAARLVVGYQDLDGWIDKPYQEDANDTKDSSLRLKIKAQPTDRLSIGASVWMSRRDQSESTNSLENGTRPTNLEEPTSTDFDAYGLKVDYDFPGFSVASSTSYLDYEIDLKGSVTAGTVLHYIYPSEVFAEELNLVSKNAGAWRWSLGGIYRKETDKSQNLYITYPQFAENVYESESYAAYGELTRLFFDGQVGLTGGLRYYEDRVTQTELATNGLTTAPPAGRYADATFSATTPRAVLTWNPDDQKTVYASYSEGFRSGRAQSLFVLRANPAVAPIDPDTLKNYELGAKANFLDGRLNLDAAVYYMDWQDIQQLLTVFDPAIGNSYFTLVNGASASGMGIDFGAAIEPIEGLTLGSTFSMNDLGFDTDVISGGSVIYFKGDRPSISPKYTIGGSVDYSVPVGGGGYEARLSGSINYTSGFIARVSNFGVLSDEPVNAITIARASLAIDAPGGWTASVYADNLNNEKDSPSVTYDNSGFGSQRIRPRTIGVQFEYNFGRR